VPVCVRAVAAWKLSGLDQGLRNSSGSLAIFAAIRSAGPHSFDLAVFGNPITLPVVQCTLSAYSTN
jgi:hypothetical protein